VILVTVGSQLPFDRLVGPVAEWARARGRTDLVFQDGNGAVRLDGFERLGFTSADEIGALVAKADVVVSHVGMGTILTCLELGKPLVAMPRTVALAETRNDHQFATARRFESRAGIFIAWKESEIPALLDRAAELSAGARIAPVASPELIAALRGFIRETRR
jgi:UDP-N-acetylglucosamine transferase subunit ALG13